MFAGMQGNTACTSAYYLEVFAILLRMLPNKKGITYRRYEGRRCTDYDHFYKVWGGEDTLRSRPFRESRGMPLPVTNICHL